MPEQKRTIPLMLNGEKTAENLFRDSERVVLKVFIVGVGPNTCYMTSAANNIIDKCRIVVGWSEVISSLDPRIIKGKTVIEQNVSNYQEVMRMAAEKATILNENIALLVQDDPSTYSGLKIIRNHFPQFNIESIPAVSSLQLLAAAAHISLEDALLVVYSPDAHGNIDQQDLIIKRLRMIRAQHDGYSLLILSDLEQTLSETAAFLIEHGIPENTETVVGECLGMEDERVSNFVLSEIVTRDFHWMSCMAVRK